MSVSSNVEIMTSTELRAYGDRWFQKGVERGRFEQRMEESRAKEPEANEGADKDGHRGVRVGEASADLPATSEFMDVTGGESAAISSARPEVGETATFGCKRAGGLVDSNCMVACDCDRTQRLATPATNGAEAEATDIDANNAEADRQIANDVLAWLKARGLYDPRDYQCEGPDVAALLTEHEENLQITPTEGKPFGYLYSTDGATGTIDYFSRARCNEYMRNEPWTETLVYAHPQRGPDREAIAKAIERELSSLDLGCGDEVDISDCIAHFRREDNLVAANELVADFSAWCADTILALINEGK